MSSELREALQGVSAAASRWRLRLLTRMNPLEVDVLFQLAPQADLSAVLAHRAVVH